MSEVDRLFERYIDEHRAGGEADPWAFLGQVEGVDRAELAALIDSYLARAPGAEWDPEGFKGSAAERLTESLDRSLRGQAGLWPAILPRLRERARVNRTELAKRLTTSLALKPAQQPKVAEYYHQMEQGLIPARGVSDKVLDALAGIVGVGAAGIRRAGEPFGEPAPPAAGAAYARTAEPSPKYAADRAPGAERPDARAGEPGWDEVDELFRGG